MDETDKDLVPQEKTHRDNQRSTNAFLNEDRGERGDLVLVLGLLLYSLKFLSLPLQLRTLPVNLFLLLLLNFLLPLELVSNKSTTSRPECTTNESPRNRMVNGTTDKTSRSRSPQSPDCCPFLCSGQISTAHKCHYQWQSYKSSEYVSHRFSFFFGLGGTQSSCQLMDEKILEISRICYWRVNRNG